MATVSKDIPNWDIVKGLVLWCLSPNLAEMPLRIPKGEYAAFARLLRKVREDAGITQRAVALSLGTPQSFVSKYEAGERRLDVLEFERLADALKTTTTEILNQLKQTRKGTE